MRGQENMKRVLTFCITALLMVLLVSCGAKNDVRTLNDFENAYITMGYTLDNKDTPFYQMIGAQDGVMFDIGNSTVKIYEYKTIDDLKQNQQKYPITNNMSSNGKFLLDTISQDAINVFKGVK